MIQIVEQTHDEKVDLYKKCTKLELIEMLISCNLHLEAVTKQLNKLSVSGRSEQLCRTFFPDGKTTSATKCQFCGKEKWEH